LVKSPWQNLHWPSYLHELVCVFIFLFIIYYYFLKRLAVMLIIHL